MAKKIGKFEYYTKSRVAVKADIKISSHRGEIGQMFYLEIPEFNISLKNENVEVMQREAKQLLEEKTSITWKNYLHVMLEGKTTETLQHYHPMVKINLEVKPFKQGMNYKGVVYNTLGGGMSETDVLKECGFFEDDTNEKRGDSYGFSPHDSFAGIFFFGCDKMRAVVEDTEENQEAIKKIITDFEAVLQRLYVLFNPKNIHKTLAGNLNFLTEGIPHKLLKPKDE